MEPINETNSKEISKTEEDLELGLGDIIQILAPRHEELHELVGFVDYIDETQVQLINVNNSERVNLQYTDEGVLHDESIENIILLSRSEEKGYARQNGLLVHRWIELEFKSDIKQTITGQITNLEKDMIEVTTWPERNVFYIDFAYKGVPLDIPLREITLREKPLQVTVKSLKDLTDDGMEEEKEDDIATMEEDDKGEEVIKIPENVIEDSNFKNRLEDLYIEVDSIQFGDKLEKVAQEVEVPESEQRYTIEAQVNDMMDELLSDIPDHLRTRKVLENINLNIARFKELRAEFSIFDKNGTISDYKKFNSSYKPLVKKLHNIDTNLKWILPVVKQRNKIHISKEEEGIITNENDYQVELMDEVISSQLEKVEKHFSKDKANFDYEIYEREMQELTRPFSDPLNDDQVLFSTNVMTNIDTIVENLEDFYSSVCRIDKGNTKISKEKFLIQRYNLGLEQSGETILKNGKSIFKKVPLTKNDNINISSILMLPETVIDYSKIHYPATSILKKTNYHMHFFSLSKLLKSNKEIIPHVIDDLTKEFSYYTKEKTNYDEENSPNGEKENFKVNVNFFKQFNQFMLDEDVTALSNNKYEDFLQKILPKTKVVVEIVRKYIKDKISFYHTLKEMEPFMVYPFHISYKQYLSIRRIIIEKMKELKVINENNNNDLLFLKNSNYNVNAKKSTIELLISEKGQFVDTILDLYKLPNKSTPQESIKHIYELDQGKLYNEVVQSIMYSLLNPENLIYSFSNVDDVTDVEKIKPDDCGSKYLAKKYNSIEDLQEDNNNDDIYFDLELDDTPYEILEKYQEDKERMNEDLFFDFLVENLIAKHGCMEEKAPELAKTLISGKKKVENGHYCIVEIFAKLKEGQDRSKMSKTEIEQLESEEELTKKISYYKRINDTWILDDSLNDYSFSNNNELFCNISQYCFKNRKNKQCEPMNYVQARYRDFTKQSLLNEFQERFSMTMEELEKKIEKYVDLYANQIRKLYRNKILNEHKYNNIAYQISNYADDKPLILSPYLDIRDKILATMDYAKKQNYICLFVDNFCREPLVENLKEEPNWFYCRKTNTKLFPHSIYELAKVFIENGNDETEREFIFKKYGTESDDGEAIVDKYSGYVLQKRELVDEQLYTAEGQKINSHEIMQEELGTISKIKMNAKDKIYENELNEMIQNILKSVCSNIGVKLNSVEEFVKPLSVQFCEDNSYILTEERYKQKGEKLKKQNKKPLGPYQKYRNERRLLIVCSLLLVAVQTSTPSIQVRKTFPGCVKSFNGYPQTGIENIEGINYLSCVLYQMRSKFEPWNAFEKLNQEKIKNRLVDVIEKYIVDSVEIKEKYNKKREYLELHPEEYIPEEHAIEKWRQFMPPLIKTNTANKMNNVSSDFEKELNHQLKKNTIRQNQMIGMLKNKNRGFTYSMIELINENISGKTLLLKTNSQIPFLENACCNESANDIMPLVYFSKDENILIQFIQFMKSNQKIIDYVNDLSKPSILFHNEPTRIIYPALPSGFLEKDIYQTIIHYTNLDNDQPIPLELKEIMEEKPDYYKKEQSLDEKIVLLKKNGKRYNMSHLHQLLNIVNRKNMVNNFIPKNFDKLDAFKNVIESHIEKEVYIIKKPCMEHLLRVINKFDSTKMYNELTEESKQLHSYLLTSNNNMRTIISNFLKENGNFKPSEFNKMMEFINTIDKWELTEKNSMSSIGNYFYECFHNLCVIYPIIVLNKTNTSPNIPGKRKGFADKHVSHLENYIQKHFAELEQYKEDKILCKLLEIINMELSDIFTFVSYIPLFEPIVKDGNNYYSFLREDTYIQLYLYVMYCLIEYFILTTDNEDLLIQQTNIQREQAREQIEEVRDPANYIESSNSQINEDNLERSNNLDEVLIYTGRKEELNKKVANYLKAVLSIEKTNKETINMSYENIMKKVNRAKEREKQNMISKLEQMSKEERKVEDKFKQYRLDKWNVGQQVALIRYDKNVYDREVNELIEQVTNEVGGNLIDVNQYDGYENMGVFLEDLEQHELEMRNEEEVAERNDISNLGEHFMDGQYYEEDIENDLT